MADVATRSGKKRVSYDVLHNLSTVDLLYDKEKKRRKFRVKSMEFYEAERVVASRKDSEVRIILLQDVIYPLP